LNRDAAGDGDQAPHHGRHRAHRMQRRPRQQRTAGDLHERPREPVVRAQEAPPLGVEAGQDTVPLGEEVRHDRRQPLGRDQRVGDSAGGQRVAGPRGVAEQHGARREAGAGPAAEARPSRRRGERRGPLEQLAQERLAGDPARERRPRAAREGPIFSQAGHQELAVGERRHVELMSAADEDLQQIAGRAPGAEAEVHPDAEAGRAARGTVESQRAPDR